MDENTINLLNDFLKIKPDKPTEKELEWTSLINRTKVKDYIEQVIKTLGLPENMQERLRSIPTKMISENQMSGITKFSPWSSEQEKTNPPLGFYTTQPMFSLYPDYTPSGGITLSENSYPDTLAHEFGHSLFGSVGVGNQGYMPTGGNTFEDWLLNYPPEERNMERLAEIFTTVPLKEMGPLLKALMVGYKTQ